MRDEEIATTLRTFLTQLLVELLITFHIGVRGQLNRDIGVVVQQFNQLVQLFFRSFRQLPSAELIEDVVHLHGATDRAEREVDGVGLAVLQAVGVPLLFGIQVTAGGR